MSLIKAIRSQIGLSSTASQNFTLDASAANGTLKLARGNAGATTQDILTVDAAGVVTMNQGVSDTSVKTALNATGDAPVFGCRAWVNFNGVPLTGTYAQSGTTVTVTTQGICLTQLNFNECISNDLMFFKF